MSARNGNKASSRDRGKVILSDNAEEAPISGPTRRKLTPEAIDTNIRTESLLLEPTDATEKGACELAASLYGRPNRTKALAEGVWGVTRMIGCGNTMMSDGLVARMVWIGCEDGWDRL